MHVTEYAGSKRRKNTGLRYETVHDRHAWPTLTNGYYNYAEYFSLLVCKALW